MRTLAVTLVGGALVSAGLVISSPAAAQAALGQTRQNVILAQFYEENAPQPRRRAPTQLRVYRDRTYLPPNAVRTCESWLEQEFRPSGTVIVPRMRCRWVVG